MGIDAHGRSLSAEGEQQAHARLKAAGHAVHIEKLPGPLDRAWLGAAVRDAEALVLAMEPIDAALIAAAPGLRVIARPGIGFDNVDLAAATKAGAVVTLALGTNDASVADFTLPCCSRRCVAHRRLRKACATGADETRRLADQHLADAATDVLAVQGGGSPSPLIGVPGIVVTPHMASFTRESMRRVALSVADSLIAALRGDRPAHVANPEVFAAPASLARR